MKRITISSLFTFGRGAIILSRLFAPQFLAGAFLLWVAGLAMSQTSVIYNTAVSQAVTENALPPPDPGNPTSNSPQPVETGVTITRAGTPPPGVQWYWQTSASGTSTAHSGATLLVYVSGTYYIRARDNNTGFWSIGAGSATVIVTENTLPDRFTLNIAISGQGSVTVNGNTYSDAISETEGAIIALAALAEVGWEFVNWTDANDDEVSDQAIFNYTMPASTVTLTASFIEQSTTFNCGDVYTDTRDGSTYNTVLIGDQCWMKENLAYLPSVMDPSSGSEIESYYYVYGYAGTNVNEAKATENYQHYGVLYNWSAAMAGSASSSTNPSGLQGACPSGWHVPSDGEWTQVVNYLVSQGYPNEWDNVNGAGNALKSVRRDPDFHPRWDSHASHHGIDAFDFSALPGGLYSFNYFDFLGLYGTWWTTTVDSSSDVWSYRIWYNFGNVGRLHSLNSFGFSVRCVCDSYSDDETPENRDLQQETIQPGESVCFDALQTITVSDFSIQAGGSASFVAGLNIIFGPGTVVESGGYLHAHITQTGNYCSPAAPTAKVEASIEETITNIETPKDADESAFFRVFPNPTAGSFTLELGDQYDHATVYVDVYSLLGNRVVRRELPAEQQYILSLEGQQPGIYIIRVVQGDRVGVERLIKR